MRDVIVNELAALVKAHRDRDANWYNEVWCLLVASTHGSIVLCSADAF